MENIDLHMNRAQLVDHYLTRISEPHFDISVVRNELEKNSIPEDEIRVHSEARGQ